jgi:hypothetical protein
MLHGGEKSAAPFGLAIAHHGLRLWHKDALNQTFAWGKEVSRGAFYSEAPGKPFLRRFCFFSKSL